MSTLINSRTGILEDRNTLDYKTRHQVPLHALPGNVDIALMRVAIVLPVYNEEKRFDLVTSFVSKLSAFLKSQVFQSCIYLVNDGSTDQTSGLVEQMIRAAPEADNPVGVRHIALETNTKKAGVYLAAAQNIDADYYVFVDADDSFLVSDVAHMIDNLCSNSVDIVVGTKANLPRHCRLRCIMSAVNRLLTRPFLPEGVVDSQTGLKGFNRLSLQSTAAAVRIEHGFAADLILLNEGRRQQKRIRQVPVACQDREGSHVSPVRDGLGFLRTLGKLALHSMTSRQAVLTNENQRGKTLPPELYKLPVDASRTTVLVLSWRDIHSRKHGGAERYMHEVLKRSDPRHYRVLHFSPQENGLPAFECVDGVAYIRRGNPLTVIWHAAHYYLRNRAAIDTVVDQCNTHRFFTQFWVPIQKRIFLIHQLTRDIWFTNATFPLNWLGFVAETPLLKLANRDRTITISESTVADLTHLGFDPRNVYIVPIGVDVPAQPPQCFEKALNKTFLYVGRFVPYKGIVDGIHAFTQVKHRHSDAKLWLAGKADLDYLEAEVLPLLNQHGLTCTAAPDQTGDVVLWGFVTEEEKLALMRQAKALLFPSRREGWGLTVTESARVGTPSIVYPAPGLVDAVDGGRAGYLARAMTSEALAEAMLRCLEDPITYSQVCEDSYAFSHDFTWERTAARFQMLMASPLHPFGRLV